jgi:hypothetical protein
MVAHETADSHVQSTETEPAGNEIQEPPAAAESTDQARVTVEPETPLARIRNTVQPDPVNSTQRGAGNGVKQRTVRRKHIARAKRERYAWPQRPQRSIVSQVPIVGAVFGLLGP